VLKRHWATSDVAYHAIMCGFQHAVDRPADAWMAGQCGIDLGVGQRREHPIGLLEKRVDVGVRAAGGDLPRP
jgi:hypothetical protein